MPNATKRPGRRGAMDDFFPTQGPAGIEELANAHSINVTLLEANPYQPRRTFEQAALDELAASIRADGVLQPLSVRPHPTTPGRYQIVAGERRWRAATQAGKSEVPCIEQAMDDATMERLALVENIQRSDLHPADEAHAYRRLTTAGMSAREIAASIHKHHEYVAQRLRLIADPRVEAMVRADTLAASTAQELMRIKSDAVRERLIGRAQRGEHVTIEDARNALAVERQDRQAPSAMLSPERDVAKVSPHAPMTPPVLSTSDADDMPAQVVIENKVQSPQHIPEGELLNRAHASPLTSDERERYHYTALRSLRTIPKPPLEALLEFGMAENMTVKTLLRLCRETWRDEGMT